MLHMPSPPLPLTDRRLQAIFLDRDGVINARRITHVTRWEEFVFLPGVKAALAQLAALNLPVFVVTNQAIVNRGIVSRETIETIHERMCAEIAVAGGVVTKVAYCPHRPDEQCGCRKPAPGMPLDLASRYGLDASRCLMVGDSCSDLIAGQAAGCRTALVLTGQGREDVIRASSLGISNFMVATDLPAVVQQIIRQWMPYRVYPAIPAAVPAAEAAD
ncbi:MAG TPA: HAD family hydrolase [Thermomicrobiales bacterium]|jgi:D-glycero-D-manno-heptose 1,7-bisphosphate phosphatase